MDTDVADYVNKYFLGKIPLLTYSPDHTDHSKVNFMFSFGQAGPYLRNKRTQANEARLRFVYS